MVMEILIKPHKVLLLLKYPTLTFGFAKLMKIEGLNFPDMYGVSLMPPVEIMHGKKNPTKDGMHAGVG